MTIPGLVQTCTLGKRATKGMQHTWRKWPTRCILLKTTTANWCSSTAGKTGFKHEASLTCCWLKRSHELTARHTQRMILMTPFIAAQQLVTSHTSVSCAHSTQLSPVAGHSLATALAHTFFPNQNGICMLQRSLSILLAAHYLSSFHTRHGLSILNWEQPWLGRNFEGSGSNDFILVKRSEKI